MEIIVIKMGGVASDNLTPVFFEQVAQWQALGKKNRDCSWWRPLYLGNAAEIVTADSDQRRLEGNGCANSWRSLAWFCWDKSSQ